MDKRFPLEDQIEMLGSALRGRLVTPTHADYHAMRLGSIANADCRPAAIIRVANAADVAAVLNFAQATDLEVAIRSGGHGSFGTTGGLLIDLRDLNRIDIDAANRVAWCGTGLTAGEVTRAVEQHGLIVGFGDSASVGIGGLTLGGGIGYMARRDGLTIDSLLAAEIVTASGEIITADSEHHPDLFWALRGGGGNFGVVTRLKYRLNPLPAFTGGPLVLPATAEVLAGFAAAAAAAPDELTTIALVLPCPPLPFLPPELHGRIVLVGMMAYAGPADRAQGVLAPFRALAKPYADLVRPAPYSSMYLPEEPGMRSQVTLRSRFTGTFGVAEAADMLARLEACDAPMKIGQFRVLGGACGRAAADATAFAHRSSPVMVTYIAMHGGGADGARHDAWGTAAIEALLQGADGVYVNFLESDSADRRQAAYPGSTWDRLRTVKRRYDPENLFRLNHNIPPAR
jgi:FAD/FMN-containing dehydrogenase